jgi:hypothetical protein
MAAAAAVASARRLTKLEPLKKGTVPKIVDEQCGKLCTVHALNNALQKKIFTGSDALDALRREYDATKADVESRGKTMRTTWEKYKADMTEGGFSPTLWRSMLHAKTDFTVDRYFTSSRAILDLARSGRMDKGRWLIAGVSNGRYRHSIAVVDGYVIDSELDSVFMMVPSEDNPFPAHYKPETAVEIVPASDDAEDDDDVLVVDD